MSLELFTRSVLDHLAAGGLQIGRGVQPDGTGWRGGQPGFSDFVGYGILWRIGSKDQTSATIDDVNELWRPTYFIRVFDADAPSTDQLMDQVRTRMLHVPLEVPGFNVERVVLDNSQTTTRSTATEPNTGPFEAGDFYRLTAVPA